MFAYQLDSDIATFLTSQMAWKINTVFHSIVFIRVFRLPRTYSTLNSYILITNDGSSNTYSSPWTASMPTNNNSLN